MNRYIKILLGLLLFVVIFTLLLTQTPLFRNQDTLLTRLQCKLVDYNRIEVLPGDLDIKDIELRLYTGQLIFQNGEKIGQIPRAYGEVSFLVYHKEQLLAQAGLHNLNSWQTHDYIFDFQKDIFDFRVKGPDAKTLYFKTISFDSLANVQTEYFYEQSGATGQVNKQYYNASKLPLVDETWVNDTLNAVNLYENGQFAQHYSIRKYSEDTKYVLRKINTTGVLLYELTMKQQDTMWTEQIVVKK